MSRFVVISGKMTAINKNKQKQTKKNEIIKMKSIILQTFNGVKPNKSEKNY